MYLMMLQDGTVIKVKTVTPEELESMDDAGCAVIDISKPEAPKEYLDGEWQEIKDGEN